MVSGNLNLLSFRNVASSQNQHQITLNVSDLEIFTKKWKEIWFNKIDKQIGVKKRKHKYYDPLNIPSLRNVSRPQ